MPRHLSKRLISWASLLDEKALAQVERAASMPFVFPHLALMPDAHLGKGAAGRTPARRHAARSLGTTCAQR